MRSIKRQIERHVQLLIHVSCNVPCIMLEDVPVEGQVSRSESRSSRFMIITLRRPLGHVSKRASEMMRPHVTLESLRRDFDMSRELFFTRENYFPS